MPPTRFITAVNPRSILSNGYTANITLANTIADTSWDPASIAACLGGTVVAVAVVALLLLLLIRTHRRHAKLLVDIERGIHPTHGRNRKEQTIIEPFPSIRQFGLGVLPSPCSGPDTNATFNKESMNDELDSHHVDLILLAIPSPMNLKHGHLGISNTSSCASPWPPTPELTRPKRARLQIPGGGNTSPGSNSHRLRGSSAVVETIEAPPRQCVHSAMSPTCVPPRSGPEAGAAGAAQDEDSGTRLAQESESGRFFEVLPPSYTVH